MNNRVHITFVFLGMLFAKRTRVWGCLLLKQMHQQASKIFDIQMCQHGKCILIITYFCRFMTGILPMLRKKQCSTINLTYLHSFCYAMFRF